MQEEFEYVSGRKVSLQILPKLTEGQSLIISSSVGCLEVLDQNGRTVAYCTNLVFSDLPGTGSDPSPMFPFGCAPTRNPYFETIFRHRNNGVVFLDKNLNPIQ